LNSQAEGKMEIKDRKNKNATIILFTIFRINSGSGGIKKPFFFFRKFTYFQIIPFCSFLYQLLIENEDAGPIAIF
jgi:hypothetical protein